MMDIEDLEAILWSLLCCAGPKIETGLEKRDEMREDIARNFKEYSKQDEHICKEKTQAQRQDWWKVGWCLRLWRKVKNRIRKRFRYHLRQEDTKTEFDAEIREFATF